MSGAPFMSSWAPPFKKANHQFFPVGNRSSVDEQRPDSSHGDDETIVEPDQGNVLSHIISQLRPGADLSRVTLPTFILEPRSMLERITNFMAHPETLLPMPEIEDPVQRFISVVKFYLSGWHIKPPGVKKPLNPILGEYYTCYWEYPDHTRGYYISEQTSHHPPKSSYFYIAPEHHIRVDGTLKPRSKFLGNSAASLMEGIAILSFTNRTTKSKLSILTQPNMYARGILFGKMKYELGDHSYVRCPENDLVADIEFKTKGWVGGTYNAIGGFIKRESTQEALFELSGMWNGEMFIKDQMTGHKDLLFDATHAKPTMPLVRPIQEQEERESVKLWSTVIAALKERNHDVATDEKTKIEDMQRQEASKRAEDGVEWRPRLFRRVQGGPGGQDEGEEDLDWILNANINGSTPEEISKQVLSIAPILPGDPPLSKYQIPAHVEGHEHPQPPTVKEEPKASEQQPQQQQPPPPDPTHQTGSLIDFGADGTSAVPAAPTAKASNNIHEGNVPPAGLQQPILPTSSPKATRQPLVREDTSTQEVDEFFDAHD
ncbi:MAG: hypothetical protein M1824_003733 [Vezdaea acicularis]|nr:MAG: hypothetical protein M1824_003733 [Vezdaea acicularis]